MWLAWLLLACAGMQSPAQTEAVDLDGRVIRDIRIEGLRRTRSEIVLKQLASRIGQPYRRGAEEFDRRLLDRLWIFSSITVTPRSDGEDVVLDIKVRETLPYSLYPSVSSTQENGLSVGPAFGSINFAGRAVKVDLVSEFGGATNFSFRVRSPLLTQRPWWYEVGYAKARRDNNLFHFAENSHTARVLLGRQLNSNLRLLTRFDLLSLGSADPGITLNPAGRDTIPSLSLGLQYDTRDLWSNSTSGWFLQVDSARNGLFGGEGGWWTNNAEMRRYQKVSDRNTVAAFSLLSMQTGEVGKDLPVYMQYGIGGTNAIRGWNIDARIGKNQWLNTVEYRYELVKIRPIRFFGYNAYWGLHLAIFGDLGTAWSENGQFTRNFIGSGGYGVRLVIPYVGMIRFDRAYGNGFRPCWSAGDRVDAWQSRVR